MVELSHRDTMVTWFQPEAEENVLTHRFNVAKYHRQTTALFDPGYVTFAQIFEFITDGLERGMKTGENLPEREEFWRFQMDQPCGIILNWDLHQFAANQHLLGEPQAGNYYIFSHTMEVRIDGTSTSASLHSFYPVWDS